MVGCAAMAEREAMDVERLLAAAGFKMQFASTPDLVAHLETVRPQRKLVAAPVDGKAMYFYADSKYCECMYAGDAEAYGRYQRLSVDRQIAEDYRNAAQAEEEAAANVWAGPWGPWGYW
jgi:hypothetical protein